MNAWVLLLVLVSNIALAQEKGRPMSEMRGDCSAFKMNLTQELALWKENGLRAKSGESLPVSKRLNLALSPTNAVKFITPPGKTFPVEGQTYAGVYSFETTEGGIYRVSAGAKVWFDVVHPSTKKPIDSSEFEMQTGCDQIFKVVTFELQPKTRYALQVSSSAQPGASFLISKP